MDRETLQEIIKLETKSVFEGYFDKDTTDTMSNKEFYESVYGKEILDEGMSDYLVGIGGSAMLAGHSMATMGGDMSSELQTTLVFSSVILGAILGKIGSVFNGSDTSQLEDELLENVASRDKLLVQLRKTDDPREMKNIKNEIKRLTRKQMRIGSRLKNSGTMYRDNEFAIIIAAEKGGLTGIKQFAKKEI